METGGTSENSGDDGADNVINFPRKWFGSTDDLIPIGSAADRLEEEAAAAERERTQALSADDFWGEGAGALHQPVDVPHDHAAAAVVARAEPPARPVVVARSRDRKWARMPRAPHVQMPRLRVPRLVLPHLPVPRAALLLGAMVIGAVALFVAGAFGTGGRTSRVLSPQTASSVGVGPAPHVQSAQTALVAASQDAVLAASHLKVSRAHARRHVAHKAGRRKADTHRSTTSHRHSTAKASTLTHVSADLTAAPATGADSTSAESSDTQAQSIAPETTSSSAKTPPATSSAASSANAAGPTGLGNSTGCSPKCS